MKTVIVGCGRVGAAVAEAFDRAGHEVIIIDRSTSAFDKLDDSFHGTALRGDGTDEDVLRRAGAQDADLFLALTEGDNRNTMSAQLAAEALGARQVVAKINDPLRAEAYADLGIATICRTDLMLDAILDLHRSAGEPADRCPGGQGPAPGRGASRGETVDPAVAGPWRRVAPGHRRRWRERHRPEGGLSRVRPRRRRREGRLLPGQGTRPGRPRGRAPREGRGPRRPDRRRDRLDRHRPRRLRGQVPRRSRRHRADIVAAVTGDDEDNLVICQMAKHHFDVPRTIARVNNPKNEALFSHLGVDEIISPTRMILGSIEQDIPVHELLHLGTLGGSDLELIEAPLLHGSPAIGRSAQRPVHPGGLFALRGRPRRPWRCRSDRTRSSSRATRSSPSARRPARPPSTPSSSATAGARGRLTRPDRPTSAQGLDNDIVKVP